MGDLLENKLFVYCGVCLSFEGPFYLTSCAHILCHTHHDKHIHDHQNSSNPESNTKEKDSNGKTDKPSSVCPVCNTKDISVISLSEGSFPVDIQAYFKPFLPSLEAIYATARFQYEGLTELAKHQKKQIIKLNSKISHYKETLKTIRREIIKLNEYKS